MTAPQPDPDRLVAAVALIDRLGGRDLEFGRDYTTEPATWFASVRHAGRSKFTDGHPDPATAVEDLAARIIAGDRCSDCRRPLSLGATALPGRCAYVRRGDTYTRSCDQQAAAS